LLDEGKGTGRGDLVYGDVEQRKRSWSQSCVLWILSIAGSLARK
jgi:hypothetical protein